MSRIHRLTLTIDTPLGDPIAPPLGQFIEDHKDIIMGQVELAPAGSRTLVRLTLNCDPSEAVGLEQYLRDLYDARGLKTVGAGALDGRRYGGGPPEPFYRQLSKDLLQRHGPLRSVRCVSGFPRFEIWFSYADGVRIYSGRRTGTYDIHFLTLGYVGEGPRYAKAFLEEAGFSMSAEEIDSIRPGAAIELRDGRVVASYPEESADSQVESAPDRVTPPSVTLENDITLHKAIIEKDSAKVRALIARGDDIHAVDGDGATPLHYAAHMAQAEIAKILLERGARVDARNKKGRTPLHEAAGHLHREGDEAMMSVLLAAGASLETPDNEGMRPLHLAAVAGHYEAARVLLDRGADIEGRTSGPSEAQTGIPAIHFSAYAGKPEVTKLLIARGADVFAQKDGLDTLHMARQPSHSTEAGKRDVVLMLEEAVAEGRRKKATPEGPPSRGPSEKTIMPQNQLTMGKRQWWQFWK